MNFINDKDHLDQHFLIDENVIKKIIEVSNFSEKDIVVEIGPGKGNITKLIAKRVKKVYCIELDKRLKPYLDNICKDYKNVNVIYNNVLVTDIPKCNKIVTALPYSILEPFMTKLIKTDFQELFMIIGSKYVYNVENNKITYLSLLTNSFFDLERIMDINSNCFNPKPRVMSSLVRITPKKEDGSKEYSFFRSMYKLNHKKIKNALVESFINTGICLTQREARKIISDINFDKELLDTKFEVCSNNQLFELYAKVTKYLK